MSNSRTNIINCLFFIVPAIDFSVHFIDSLVGEEIELMRGFEDSKMNSVLLYSTCILQGCVTLVGME